MNITKKIDQALRDRSSPMSQAELSRLSGVPQPTISRTLKGITTPDLNTLIKIGNALDIEFKGVKPEAEFERKNLTSMEKLLIEEFGKIKDYAIQMEVIGYIRGMSAATKQNQAKKSRRNTSTSPSHKKAA